MRARLSALLSILLVGPFASETLGQSRRTIELVAPTDAKTPEEERKSFHLPEGFEIQLVAAEPEINKPMNIAFDDKGRLWVTSTVEYPYPAKDGAKTRDRVVILDKFDENGRARRVTNFAENLNIPIGVLPLGGGDSALVHSIPSILRLTDADGDGKADKSEVEYTSYGFRDTHGMTNAFSWGFDGWIYACHGFSNDSEVKGADGNAIKMQSGNVYRLRADGSRLEYVTHGQVNPFGLSFDHLGNLFSADCHSRPIYCLLPGAYYPSFGKPHDGIGFGPEMMTHDHGSTGIAGVVNYSADQFPEKYRGAVFIGNVVTSRVNMDSLAWTGASPKAVPEPDFVDTDDAWFRPVDLEIGPDGALYIADFYNKVIGHYEVPLTHPGRDRTRGRIWRVVYKGREKTSKPEAPRSDWTVAGVSDLISDIGHPNLAVRVRASNRLADRGGSDIVSACRTALTDMNAFRRAHALWILARLDALEALEVERAANDADRAVRVHARRVLGERNRLDDASRSLVLAGLGDADPFVRRASAEALARHPQSGNIRPLLDLLHKTDRKDTHLTHVLRMSIREQLRPSETWAAVNRDAGAWAERDRAALADVAAGVPTAEAAAFLATGALRGKVDRDDLLRFTKHVARYGGDASPSALEGVLGGLAGVSDKVEFLKAAQQGLQERGANMSPALLNAAAKLAESLIASTKAEDRRIGIDLAASLRIRGAAGALLELSRSEKSDVPLKDAALGALLAVDQKLGLGEADRVLNSASESPVLREKAATLTASIPTAENRDRLVKALAVVPNRLQAAIALGLAQTREGGESLLSAIEAGKASPRLLQERGVDLRLTTRNVRNAKERMDVLLKGAPPADQRIRDALRIRRAAYGRATTDVELGAKVFDKICAACHQIGGKGNRVGPQLDGIGVRGLDRLLEDVVDPNLNVDQAFRVTNLALKDGRVVSGLLLREEGEVLVLADSQGKEVSVPKSSVEERTISQLSLMPANLVEQVGEADFSHLIRFLLTKSEPAPAPAK